jgi:hypothetical protein
VQSTALVPTDRAERYAKQLLSHLGRHDNLRVTESGDQVLDFSAGSCVVAAEPGGVRLTAEAEDAEKLAVVEDVVGRHLVRFGEKDELAVTWS